MIKNKLKYILGFILITLSIIIFFSVDWLKENFKLVTFEQYIFQLMVPMDGSNLEIIFKYFIDAVVPSIIIAIVINLIMVVKLVPFQTVLNFSIKNKLFSVAVFPFTFIRKFYFIISFIIFFISVIFFVVNLGVMDFVRSSVQTSTIFEEKYVNPNDVELTFPENKRNLILIHLESMESTLSSAENGGALDFDLIPELTELAKNNINFSNTNKVGGAYQSESVGWTIAGLVAETSGISYKIPIDNHDYGKYKNFLKNNISLGDILQKEGYNQMMMVGSDMKYAGRNKYYIQHGNYEIFDYYTAIDKKYIDSDYFVWWGYEDSKLFEYAKKEISNLAKKDEPFNFSMLTVNTHFYDGYLEDDCEQKYDNNYSNVFACSSKQVSNFISWIEKQDFYENTTIVLVGDHLMMNSDYLKNIDEDYERTVYNAFINSAIVSDKTNNRIFNTMDLFPTILASLGITIENDRLGLGTNLFSEEKTLAEQMGKVELDKELAKKSQFYMNNFVYN